MLPYHKTLATSLYLVLPPPSHSPTKKFGLNAGYTHFLRTVFQPIFHEKILMPDDSCPFFFFFFLSSGLLRLISLVASMGSMIVPIRVETRGFVSWLTVVPVFQCLPTGLRTLRSNCTWLPYGWGTSETCRGDGTMSYKVFLLLQSGMASLWFEKHKENRKSKWACTKICLQR